MSTRHSIKTNDFGAGFPWGANPPLKVLTGRERGRGRERFEREGLRGREGEGAGDRQKHLQNH